MSKYDFEMDLSETTSTGIIARKIKRGMTVLEFGCSFGRMTRYMKEVMDCDVYIVEYDREAYESAVKYAKDGVCGDILRYEWVEKFKNIRFDVIMFEDVLEHLSEPAKVLNEARGFLKKEGRILVSIPNITHNDIVLKSVMERFDYTDIGLLDETHLHFWGFNNLEDFAKTSNLYIEKIEATYEKTGFTEQFREFKVEASRLLLNILNERKCGEVYQFLITFSKEPIEKSSECILERPYIYSHVYLDRGEGFNEKDIIPVKALLSTNGSYYAAVRIEDVSELRQIRFDPVEFQECIIKYLTIRQGERILTPQFIDSVVTDNGILLKTDDPMVQVEVETDSEPLTIDAEILLPGEKFIDILENKVSDYQGVVENLKNEVSDYQGIVEDLDKKCHDYNENIKNLEEEHHNTIENLEGKYVKQIQNTEEKYVRQIKETEEISKKQLSTLESEKNLKISGLLKDIQNLSQTIDELGKEKKKEADRFNEIINNLHEARADDSKRIAEKYDEELRHMKEELQNKTVLLDSYRTLADSKDIYLVKTESALAEREQKIDELQSTVTEREIRIGELDAAVEHYRRFPTIRFIRFVGRILRAIKRRVKVLVQH